MPWQNMPLKRQSVPWQNMPQKWQSVPLHKFYICITVNKETG
jgi:hypothetical protein